MLLFWLLFKNMCAVLIRKCWHTCLFSIRWALDHTPPNNTSVTQINFLPYVHSSHLPAAPTQLATSPHTLFSTHSFPLKVKASLLQFKCPWYAMGFLSDYVRNRGFKSKLKWVILSVNSSPWNWGCILYWFCRVGRKNRRSLFSRLNKDTVNQTLRMHPTT